MRKIAFKTQQMAEAVMYYNMENKFLDTIRIPWHRFITNSVKHTIICPAIVMNERHLLANRECLLKIPQKEIVGVSKHPNFDE